MGNLHNSSWAKLRSAAPGVGIGVIWLFLFRWRMNVLAQGDEEARAVGLNPERERVLILIPATLAASAAIAVAGVIGMIGLAVPHMVRMMLGPDNRHTLPASFAFGGAFLLLVDTCSRTLASFEFRSGSSPPCSAGRSSSSSSKRRESDGRPSAGHPSREALLCLRREADPQRDLAGDPDWAVYRPARQERQRQIDAHAHSRRSSRLRARQRAYHGRGNPLLLVPAAGPRPRLSAPTPPAGLPLFRAGRGPDRPRQLRHLRPQAGGHGDRHRRAGTSRHYPPEGAPVHRAVGGGNNSSSASPGFWPSSPVSSSSTSRVRTSTSSIKRTCCA